MFKRKDSLCAASEALLAIERCGESESKFATVATVGIIRNEPNALNVIPGYTSLGVDVCEIKAESVRCTSEAVQEGSCGDRSPEGSTLPFRGNLLVRASMVEPSIVQELRSSAERLRLNADFMTMSSGAGYDAMKIAPYAPVGMHFIPCHDGVSYSPEEPAEIESAVRCSEGARKIDAA